MTKIEKAVTFFENGLNCSQAILTVFGEPYGLDPKNAENLGRPLGGGFERMGMTCGALTGAMLVVGLSGEGFANEEEARAHTVQAVQTLIRRFEECRGASLCKHLLGADMSTESGVQKIREEKLTRQICPGIVRDASEILSQVLAH